jgi:uncharacterized membrane protein YhhN
MLIVALFSRHEVRSSAWWLIAALAFSIAGDWMLGHRGGDTMRFVYGIALFFVAHIGFLFFCLCHGRIKTQWLCVLLAGYGLFSIFGLAPAISLSHLLLLVAVLFYMLISCFSLATSAGLRFSPLSRWLFVAGIACIVFSDTLIALHEFMYTAHWLYKSLMMPTYYGAHILITASVLRSGS